MALALRPVIGVSGQWTKLDRVAAICNGKRGRKGHKPTVTLRRLWRLQKRIAAADASMGARLPPLGDDRCNAATSVIEGIVSSGIWRDPFAILGVGHDSGDADIRTAWKTKAAQQHPDKLRDPVEREQAKARLVDINWAFQQVRSAVARQAWQAQAMRRFSAGAADPVVNAATGAAIPGSQQERGEDVQLELTIRLEDVLTGVKRRIRLVHPTTCPTCGGSGAAPGQSAHACKSCRASGVIRMGDAVVTCGQCHGKGAIVDIACPQCNDGVITTPREVEITIPPGVRSGQNLRLPGQGQPGFRVPGDVYVRVDVAQHRFFERDNADLMINLPVTFAEATLGSDVRIPALEGGQLSVQVPAGTQSGQRLRVEVNGRSAGLPRYDDPLRRGDLYAAVQVVVPQKPDHQLRRLIVQIAAYDEVDVRRHFWG